MRIAINGFGRIGRLVCRLCLENPDIEVVAINDLSKASDLAYLLKYDSNHGRYRINEIKATEDKILIGDKEILVYSCKEPKDLPWGSLGIDLVVEATGRFTSYDAVYQHILAGAKKVIISAPGKGDMKTIVYGVNEHVLDGSEEVISAASCTTNCLAPILSVLDKEFGIASGFMTTVHAYTNDQVILDVAHSKGILSRRGRAAASNIVPTSTGAASAIGKVIPSLAGRLDGIAMRVPVTTGSSVDLTLVLFEKVSADLVNKVILDNSNDTLDITFDPIVSSDIVGDRHGALVDGLLTNVLEKDGKQLVKIIGWYDNEMGYSAQMYRLVCYIGNLSK